MLVAATACSAELGAPRGATSADPPPVTTTAAGAPSVPPPPASDSSSTTKLSDTAPPLQGVALEVIVDGLSQPVFATAPVGDGRVFVVEKSGKILIVDESGTLLDEPFLDISSDVHSDSIEQGLLGLAFHPSYRNNGRLFVYYTVEGNNSRLVELFVSDDPNRADPDSREVLIEVYQPHIRHNAGMVEFGPEGLLYVSYGDGGAGSSRSAQDPDTLLGTIIRIDVDGEAPYAIPPDNPFVDGGGAPEVWGYGLRNPWRFSIDPVDRVVYIGDVGQAVWEEIDVLSLDDSGRNFGWHLVEGNHCFGDDDCDPTEFVQPVVEYDHDDGCSVTGGYVYRGSAIPELDGHYFYSDWCNGWVRSFRYENGAIGQERDWPDELGNVGQVTSYGLDAGGELLIVTWDGTVSRLVARR